MNRKGIKITLYLVLMVLFIGTVTCQQYDMLSDGDFLSPGLFFQNQDVDNQPLNEKLYTVTSSHFFFQYTSSNNPNESSLPGDLASPSLVEKKSNLRC
jgi:hypothetical protein